GVRGRGRGHQRGVRGPDRAAPGIIWQSRDVWDSPMIVIWRGAGCLAFLLGVGLVVLAALVGFGFVLGLAALFGGLLCWAVGHAENQEGRSSDLYFIPLQFWGFLFAGGGLVCVAWGAFQWLQSGLAQVGMP